MTTNKNVKADIFISHPHWDHIQGLPFFTPAYVKGNHFSLYGEAKNQQPFMNIIKNIMNEPYFPTKWETMKATFKFKEISGNQKINLDDNITIKTLNLNHPGGCLGYRIDFQNKSCCYITDAEYKEPDPLLQAFIKDADVLILDTQFTNEEYVSFSKIGWGHSTWEKGVQLSKEMNVKKLVLYHHDINRSDSELENIENQARKIHSDTIAAFEGLTVSV